MRDCASYFDMIAASCAEIEAWLAGTEHGEAALDALMARFAPSFTMIGTDGSQLDRAATRALFARLAGVKPGLAISFSAMRVIAAWDGGAAIGYDEHQRDASGPLRSRRSTAVFAREAGDGSAGSEIRWVHLQETWVTA
ncbi:polyketide cyclase [Burkholderia gladioli]|uniref:polyketide cyclase n=1 Tax=Burkholderia gladioli TaxID=28095 RepID=UPI001641CDCA|nr:polyketide cyclase [Burkholderia gladioli]